MTIAAKTAQVTADADQLILDNLELVQHAVNQVASRYPAHVEREDLWNSGACGLVEAARRYRSEAGVPFTRYAFTRIRGAIIDSARSRDWAARAVRRHLREMRQAEEQFEETNGRSAGDEELALILGIAPDELQSRRAAAVSTSLLHLDFQYPDQESLGQAIPEEDPASLPEEALADREMIGTLRDAIVYLPEPQREVVERYFLKGEKLQSIAEDLGVTDARISQISTEAINSLRAHLGRLYDGVPAVAESSPGKRSRAAYLATVGTQSTWRTRLAAADHKPQVESAKVSVG